MDEKRQALAGAYRTRLVRPEPRRGPCTQDTLYTTSLFRFKAEFFRQCGTALELGRAFVSNEYQRDYAPLLLLWKGIGQLVLRYGVRTLFGPSSIGLNYRPNPWTCSGGICACATARPTGGPGGGTAAPRPA